ncbi:MULTISPECIES: hypothetical protein [Ensifer]|uniref:hypothetical protein n=1 Tax=Ensifer TaxID=106591 RepID=UPI00046CDFBD|nr:MULTISPECIES: hypothetical protein [Ensifer]MDP9629281.1 hypothetical protein [Ensifer adhaerens]KQY63089.1 hypothetical protein ASD52_12825 [Ensifer sp. Root142]MBD9487838.1 hypothetical protein [Ensifer sp. ENS11]NOV16758.1 hypothetical protein [Ensifer canadensis]OMQ46472.1 hypothetical protein BKP54_01095 [Ensifer sp. 1H6]
MILIAPDGDRLYGYSALLDSIRGAVSSEAPFDTRGLCFRALGDVVIIEGVLRERDASQTIRRIAEEIAGAERVVVRIGCPLDLPETK